MSETSWNNRQRRRAALKVLNRRSQLDYLVAPAFILSLVFLLSIVLGVRL